CDALISIFFFYFFFFFSSRRRHTRSKRDWSSDVCSSDLTPGCEGFLHEREKLADEGIPFAFEQIRSALGQPELVPALEQVRSGRCYYFCHGPGPSLNRPGAAGAPELVHLRAVVLVDLVVRQAGEFALRQHRQQG